LLLAAIGTYGVLSYAVAQRRREISIRMALGAQRQQIGAQFLGIGLRLIAGGTAVGVVGGWLVGRAMQAVLFDTPGIHLTTFLGIAAVLGTISLAACFIPAFRATKVDPAAALRTE
jgi:ABC-type antimicrobial peptide transport system permease subunit